MDINLNSLDLEIMIKTLIYKVHTEIGRFGGIFLLNDKENAIFPAIPQLFQALKMHFQIP